MYGDYRSKIYSAWVRWLVRSAKGLKKKTSTLTIRPMAGKVMLTTPWIAMVRTHQLFFFIMKNIILSGEYQPSDYDYMEETSDEYKQESIRGNNIPSKVSVS